MQLLQVPPATHASCMRHSKCGLEVSDRLVHRLQSLEALLSNLREAGYDLGHGGDPIDGEAIVRALQSQEDQRKVLQGARAMTDGCATAWAFCLGLHVLTYRDY